jgi:internalin A
MSNFDVSKIIGYADGTDRFNRLVEITPVNLDYAMDNLPHIIETMWPQAKGVSLKGFYDSSVDFIKKFPPDTERIQFVRCKNLHIPELSHFIRLKALGLGDELRKNEVDVSELRHLESIAGYWGKGIIGMNRLHDVISLSLFSCKADSLLTMNLPDSLQCLELVRSLRLANLQGSVCFVNLGTLKLVQTSRFFSLNGIDQFEKIEEIFLENVKDIDGFSCLRGCKNLKSLHFLGCEEMPSLDWISGLGTLESVSIFRTKVMDGDMSPLLTLPRLSLVDFDNKRNYSHTAAEIRKILGIPDYDCW